MKGGIHLKRKKLVIFFSIFFSLLALAVIFLFGTQKGHDVRRFAAATILSTQHRQLAKWTFLPQDELDDMLKNIQNPKYANTILAPHIFSSKKEKNEKNNDNSSAYETFPKKDDPLIVNVETIEKKYSATSYYEGKVVTISNPFNVKIESSNLRDMGQQIFVIAKRVGAIAATNAGGFLDVNGQGNGGTSIGIVIEDGEIKNNSNNESNFVAGITDTGHMVTGKYTADELINLGVKSAAGFKPQLIANGKKLITEGDGGWGAGPRTAIGQTKDGKIILVVIDGRQAHSIGATIRELQDILYDRGAINAMAMDGGSSSSLYLDGKNVTTPSSVGHIPRYLPNIWAVIPKEGQKVKVTYDKKVLIDEDSYEK